ncbi:hypothetical protein EPO05_02925 [Patescibacteria group bacterium]|nr:MAG: hypothetical protein EPO05_02925 [Patescibacteria group bacterium]
MNQGGFWLKRHSTREESAVADTKKDCAHCQFDLCHWKRGLGGRICIIRITNPQQKISCDGCSVPKSTTEQLLTIVASLYGTAQVLMADCFQLPPRVCPMMASTAIRMNGAAVAERG